jgi:nicotinamidase-related amidase
MLEPGATTSVSADHYTEPDWDRCALVTIDTQRDTLDGGPFEVRGTTAALPVMQQALAAARRAGVPIVHVVRLYLPDGSNVDLPRRRRVEAGWRPVTPGSTGSELAPELVPSPGVSLEPDLLLAGEVQSLGPNEVAIYKPRWGAFYETPLDERLKALGVNTLVFCGCNYPNCPRTSIYEASERDYRVVLLTDAVSGLDERGREEMAAIGVSLISCTEFASAMTVNATSR